MAKRTTSTGLGINELLDKRIAASSGSYAEAMQRSAQVKRAESVLKYGGAGKGKRRMHGFLSGFISKGYADKYAMKNADPEEMERAWQELRGESEGDKPSPGKAQALPDVLSGIDDLSIKIDSILGIVTQLATRISAKDLVKVNKGGYAANAPAGGFPRTVPMSKFFGGTVTAPTATKLTAENAGKTAAQLKQEMTQKKAEASPNNQPQTFAEAVAKREAEEKAKETLKYGGNTRLHKMKHGFLSGFMSKEYADKVAMKNANPEEMEKAWAILNPKASSTGATPTPDVDTATQISAAKAQALGVQQEKTEAEDEDRQVIIDKLDEIIKLITEGGVAGAGEGKGKSGMGSLLGGLAMRAAAPAVMRAALPAIGVLGAGYLGAKTGTALYDFADKHGMTRPAQMIMDRATGIDDPDKSYREGMEASLAKKNEILKGTGYTAMSGGYKTPDGKIVYGKDLPPELQKKLGLKIPAAAAPAAAKPAPPPAAAANKEAAVAATVAENAELKSEVNQAKKEVQQITQVVASTTSVEKSAPPSKLQVVVRNVEPSVATYTASIFDHPVVHPGIYGM